MRKIVLTTLAAIAVVGALSATPAEARCWWNGYYWQCWHPRHWYWQRHHHHDWWRHHREGWYWRHHGWHHG
jgi:hypothetical protein